MGFNDGTADGQSHAGPLNFRRKERIENLVRLLRRQSHAGIAHGYEDVLVFRSLRIDIEYLIASPRNRTIISRMTSFTSTNSRCSIPFLKSRRIRLMISAARVPSFTILATAARASSRFGVSAASQRKQVLALVK